MTPEVRRVALALLTAVWALSPDIRLGQLFAHLGFLGEAHLGKGFGYIDDDELVEVLYRHRVELIARLQDTPKRGRPCGRHIVFWQFKGDRRQPEG
jgi:hypothetical protein